ncbi:MAG: SprB repeat-containing protein [Bacteroidales bacterium]|jgi:hypothetical protein
MSATSSPKDKFIFLFTTDNDDLTPVYYTLRDYYKYPSGVNIIKGCDQFISQYKSVVTTLFDTTNFVPLVSPDPDGIVPDGESKMLTLVVVISGNADVNGLVDNNSKHLLWDDLRKTLYGTFVEAIGAKTYDYQCNTEIHIIYASPFGNSFLGNINTAASPLRHYGTLMVAQTDTTPGHPDELTQSARNLFMNTVGDQLKLATATPLDSYGRICFNDIANAVTISSNIIIASEDPNNNTFYPGYSFPEIRDGDPYNMSPDIFITHPRIDDGTYNSATFNNQYLVDNSTTGVRNIINVKSVVKGTHPLKKINVDLGQYCHPSDIPGSPLHSFNQEMSGTIWKPGDSQPFTFNNVGFNDDTYENLVAIGSYEGNGQFGNCDIEHRDNEAQLTISAIKLICSVEIHPSTNGGNNGSLKITPQTGTSPYIYVWSTSDGSGIVQGANPQIQLTSGTYSVVVTDSLPNSPLTCTLSNLVVTNVNVQPVFSVILDNAYISIIRLLNQDLKIIFKRYPKLCRWCHFRSYKIRWKTFSVNPHFDFSPPANVELTNVFVTATGLELDRLFKWAYARIKVPVNQTGEILIKQPHHPVIVSGTPLEIPVEIFYIRCCRLLRPFSWLIARFYLIIGKMIDIRIIRSFRSISGR